ncbi:MAG: type IV pilus assembly protein PilM [Candidatus Sungbacteria bacterium]|nr:type IV pilus assembly protein PilM [bacterium]MDZ4260029.1 type IV pilus assembly protein PilM [Candidatus Sungbacteria bacterium]
MIDSDIPATKEKSFISSWMTSLIQPQIIGLDISDLSTKYISFGRAKNNKLNITFFGEIAHPEGIITNGEIKNEEALGEILEKWFLKKKKELPSPFVAISLPEEKSFIRLVQIPTVKPQDVANAIRWEIENQIPLPLEEVIYDYEIITSLRDNKDHLDVLITAFPKELLMSYVRTIKKAGLEPYVIEIEPQALVRACAAPLRDKEAKIILDVGRTRTGLVIFAEGSILYTATLDAGGIAFEQSIARTLGVSLDEAKKIKIDVGLDKTAHNGDVFSALASVVTIIADEIVRATSYYDSHALHAHGAAPTIGQILISGGDANLKGLDTYLASVSRIRVERIDPFFAIQNRMAHAIPPLTKREALCYTTAIGLALRDIRQE